MRGDMPILPMYEFMAWTGTTATFLPLPEPQYHTHIHTFWAAVLMNNVRVLCVP
jgi:hypothetical protein